MLLTSATGLVRLLPDWVPLSFAKIGHPLSDAVLVALHLPTVAVMVNSRLLSPFRSGWGVWVTVTVGALLGSVTLVMPGYAWVAQPDGSVGAGPLVVALYALLFVVYSYGFGATVVAWRGARTPLARKRAGVLAVALGIRDVTWGCLYLVALVYELTSGRVDLIDWVNLSVAAIALVVYLILVLYAVLVAQAVGIDLRVKGTLKHGTVAAMFVATFFVVSEAVAEFLTGQIGVAAGLLATGLLVYFLAPLQDLAGRLADTTMPDVRETDEYRTFRKLQIYGEAFSDANAHGGVSAVQRAALNGLRQRLGLDREQAQSLEAELSNNVVP